jgi:hypothetical protein
MSGREGEPVADDGGGLCTELGSARYEVPCAPHRSRHITSGKEDGRRPQSTSLRDQGHDFILA